jgi:hypothetical protein
MKKIIIGISLLVIGAIFYNIDSSWFFYSLAYLFLIIGGWKIGETLTNFLIAKEETDQEAPEEWRKAF